MKDHAYHERSAQQNPKSEEMPVLSVVIPTFNRSDYVREAIESVLMQKIDGSIECIVVNDGSTDDTEAVLSSFEDRITVLTQPNRGLNAARNAGLEAASGSFVSFLDDDDVMLPFKSELQRQALEILPEVGFVFSDFAVWRDGIRQPGGLRRWQETETGLYDLLDETGRKEIYYEEEGERRVAHAFPCDIYGLSLVQPVVLPSATLCRMSALRLCGPLPEDCSLCGDWRYFAELSKRCGAAYLDVQTTLNRSHDSATRLTNTSFRSKTASRLRMIRELWCSDCEFMADNRDLVGHTIGRLAESLYRSELNIGNAAGAAEAYSMLATSNYPLRPTTRLLRLAESVPGALGAIRSLVNLQRKVRG